MRIPFFHYTSLESLSCILGDGRITSRNSLTKRGKKIIDISIDHNQTIREALGLTDYVPMFAGFYEKFRDYKFNGYLAKEYDDPKVQNPSFYGTLNKTLQNTMGTNYQNVIIFLVDDEHVYSCADQGKVRFFSDIAIKEDALESPIENRTDLQNCLGKSVQCSNISCEIDVLDGCNASISCSDDVEALIVDNDGIEQKALAIIAKCGKPAPLTFVNSLPRNPC